MNKRTVLIHGSIILFIVLIGFGPLLLTFGAVAFANLNDCVLHEGFPNPCVVFGVDWGDMLYTFGVMGWITLASLPVAVIMFAIYLSVVIVMWLRGAIAPNPLIDTHEGAARPLFYLDPRWESVLQ